MVCAEGWLKGIGRRALGTGALMLGVAAAVQAGEFERVSVSSLGAEGNNASSHSSISANGRFVLFKSDADNLVVGDTNGAQDVFVRDLLLGLTERVSLDPAGGEFAENADLEASAQDGSISGDGRFALFRLDLLSSERWVCESGVFLRDRELATTTCVPAATDGLAFTTDYSISADGEWIGLAFGGANPLLLNRRSGASTVIPSPLPLADEFDGLSLSADGSVAAFAAGVLQVDDNGGQTMQWHLVSYERDSGRVEVLESNLATTPDVVVSGNGRFIGYTQETTVLDPVAGDGLRSDIWILDRVTGARELITGAAGGGAADGSSFLPQLSHDGRFVAMDSRAGNLVAPGYAPGSLRIYLYDRETGSAELVSKLSDAGGDVLVRGANPSLSADGRHLSFRSTASGLVAGDGNEVEDTFVWTRLPADTAALAIEVSADPSLLWPPNNMWVKVAAQAAVSGGSGEVVVSLRVEDEYGLVRNPEVIGSSAQWRLQAARRGNDRDGRRYTIVASATDSAGQRVEARTVVLVPHDRRH